MSAPKNFVAGFNHNVQHRGQVFHVQTEDSGEEIAVVTTHLFLGGTIVATRRTSYADARGAPDLRQRVRAAMEAQHKQMLRDLIAGKFDGKAHGITAYQPGEVVVASQPRAPVVEEEVDLDDFLDDMLIEEVVLDEELPRAEAAPAEAAAPFLPAAALAPAGNAFARAPASTDPGEALPTFFDDAPAVGRASAFGDGAVHTPGTSSGHRATRWDGGWDGVSTLEGIAAPPGAPAMRPAVGIAERAADAPPLQPIAPARAPRPQGGGGFGDALISDKSLDEVILAYLAGESDE